MFLCHMVIKLHNKVINQPPLILFGFHALRMIYVRMREPNYQPNLFESITRHPCILISMISVKCSGGNTSRNK